MLSSPSFWIGHCFCEIETTIITTSRKTLQNAWSKERSNRKSIYLFIMSSILKPQEAQLHLSLPGLQPPRTTKPSLASCCSCLPGLPYLISTILPPQEGQEGAGLFFSGPTLIGWVVWGGWHARDAPKITKPTHTEPTNMGVERKSETSFVSTNECNKKRKEKELSSIV